MTRRLSVTMIVVLLVSFLISFPVSAAKLYYAEYMNVQIDIQENGSAVITETVKFHFKGDPFTFVFREVSAHETDGLTFLEASMDGVPMARGTQAGQVEVQEGNPLKVTWHFSPTSETAHVFIVRYRANGVIRKQDGDTLVWRAIPEDHDYRIDSSRITLTYPQYATLLGQPTLSWNFDSAWEENQIILTVTDVAENQDLILTARFTPNNLTEITPRWQIQEQQAAAATATALPVGFIAGVATLIIGGLGLFTYIRANGRELNVSPIISMPIPPSDVSPAIIAKLTKQQHTFMGAIFDLAQRGVLEIGEESRFWGTRNHVLVRKDHSVSLKSFERALIDTLFKSGETKINMNEVANRLATKNDLFNEALEEELIWRGWLDPDRKQKQTVLFAVGLTSIFLVIGLCIAAVLLGIGWNQNINLAIIFAAAAGTSLGVFILALALLICAGTFSILTAAGEEQAARWRSFAEYLKRVSKGREPAIRPDYFERYLAYAAVSGLGAKWAKYFQQLGGVPLPIWFRAMAGSNADFGAMVAVMSVSDSAGPSAGASEGGGASGGGSSGAG